ncbi:hypothetical protein Tsubulata_019486 [Turnera subulata]|uniref:Uncharacterized protein n=1 Tax=Turnera subulata TaxID=218843 RepID=A0A9Q0IZF5_9ROSI|nr:hypothetical protein Tsubulata_019486 [Turnera subulata]
MTMREMRNTQIGQHFNDGYLHKDEFKIVYVARMKVATVDYSSLILVMVLCLLHSNILELVVDSLRIGHQAMENELQIVTFESSKGSQGQL